MTVKTVTAFNVEAVDQGDPDAPPCDLCRRTWPSAIPVESRWAVTNHDDKGDPRGACDTCLSETMREWRA